MDDCDCDGLLWVPRDGVTRALIVNGIVAELVALAESVSLLDALRSSDAVALEDPAPVADGPEAESDLVCESTT